MAEKVYIIYDERAVLQDTDDCAVLEACESLREVRRTTWDGKRDHLGVVCEYDLVNGEAINERKLGTVPEVKAAGTKEPR